MVDALSNLYLTSTQAARKARRKERRKAAARAEIEEGTTDKPICVNPTHFHDQMTHPVVIDVTNGCEPRIPLRFDLERISECSTLRLYLSKSGE